ncbi:hypothetical protein ACOMHN_049274 [Nucella lapillus]
MWCSSNNSDEACSWLDSSDNGQANFSSAESNMEWNMDNYRNVTSESYDDGPYSRSGTVSRYDADTESDEEFDYMAPSSPMIVEGDPLPAWSYHVYAEIPEEGGPLVLDGDVLGYSMPPPPAQELLVDVLRKVEVGEGKFRGADGVVLGYVYSQQFPGGEESLNATIRRNDDAFTLENQWRLPPARPHMPVHMDTTDESTASASETDSLYERPAKKPRLDCETDQGGESDWIN